MVEHTVLRFPVNTEGPLNRLPVKPMCEYKTQLITQWYGSKALPYPEEAYENLVTVQPKVPEEYTIWDKVKRFFFISAVIFKATTERVVREDWPENRMWNELTLIGATDEEKERIFSSLESYAIVTT